MNVDLEDSYKKLEEEPKKDDAVKKLDENFKEQVIKN